MKNSKQDLTILDFTQEVKTKVKELYKSELMQNKALFILYLINRASNSDPNYGYQLHVKNHRDILSITSGTQWNKFFTPLIESGLIICTTPHLEKQYSKKYKITNNYKWIHTKGEVKIRYYGKDYRSMPDYIQKFHLDKQVVMKKEISKWTEDYEYIVQEEEDEFTMYDEFIELQNQVRVLLSNSVDIERMKEDQMQLVDLVKKQSQIITEMQNEINELRIKLETKEETHHGEFPNKNIEETPMFAEEDEIDFSTLTVSEAQAEYYNRLTNGIN